MFLPFFRSGKFLKRRAAGPRLAPATDLCESRMLLSAHVAAAFDSLHLMGRARPEILPETFSGSWTLGGATNLHLSQVGTKSTGGFFTPGVVNGELKGKGTVNQDNLVVTFKGRYTDSGLGTGKAKFTMNVNLVDANHFTGTIQLDFKGVHSGLQPIDGTKFVP